MTAPRVLVVDDNRDMANGIAMLLGEFALDVHVVHSARAALTRLALHDFALVLSDVRMPGMDGAALLARIRERWPRTRVVLLTAYGSIDAAVDAMKQGANDYVTKPFDNDALVAAVKRQLALPAPGGGFDSPDVVAAVAAVLSPDDLSRTLVQALDLVRVASGADDCELFLLEPDGKDALLCVCVGPDGDVLVDQTRFGPHTGYPGIVAATGQPLTMRGGLAEDPRYLRQGVVARGIRSYACAPLAEPRGSIGSIHLLSRHKDFAVDRAVALLSRVAVPITAAVRAGLSALRQRVDEACAQHEHGSAAELRSMLECVRAVAGASDGTLALVASDSGLPTRVVSTGPVSLLCGLAEAGAWTQCPSLLARHGFAAEHGRRAWPAPCRRGMPRRVQSPCCLPLAVNDRFHGMVALDLGRGIEGHAESGLVPLLVSAQQAAIRLGSRYAGISIPEPGLAAVPSVRQPVPPDLQLRCLGPFGIFQRGLPVRAEQFPRSKALVLLKLLALKAGAPLNRDFLIEQLWPEADPQSGTNRLHGVVHALRTVIEPVRSDGSRLFVRNRGELYYLDLDAPIEIDLVRYRKLLRGALRPGAGAPADVTATLEEAVALYRGDLFEDEPYADWCERERRELQELQISALKRLAQLQGAARLVDAAAAHLRSAARLAPHREDVVRQLLDVLLSAGRTAEARSAYDDFRRALEEQLGLQPSRGLSQRLTGVTERPLDPNG